MSVCLDTWAVIEWLYGNEPSRSRIERSLDDRPLMSWINLGEVAYVVRREFSSRRSDSTVARLQSALTLDPASPDRVLAAARLKIDHGLGYADAFAVATALAHDAVLLTGDAELLARAPCQLEDLRA